MPTPALNIWGTPPTARYEHLAAPFRPLFAHILAQAAEVAREAEGTHFEAAFGDIDGGRGGPGGDRGRGRGGGLRYGRGRAGLQGAGFRLHRLGKAGGRQQGQCVREGS